MKFGDTLRERSIPQWAYRESIDFAGCQGDMLTCFSADNLDYDDLKRMVKHNTTSTHNQPRFIPGQGNEAKASIEFENELYGQLSEQHERVGRFVQSKADELACRLGTPHATRISTRAHKYSRSGEASGETKTTNHSVQ